MRSLKITLTVLALLLLVTAASAFPESKHAAMKDPSKAVEKAPETFTAKLETTKGDIVFECTRSWAPNGVDRFYNLMKIGFFNDVAMFRVKKGFVVQWGIHGNPEISSIWKNANLPVDPVQKQISNTRGTLTYAMAGSPTTRSTQLFINYGNNARLDAMGFAPVCKVIQGMEEVAEKLYGDYGEKPSGKQGDIQSKGNAYLREAWPNLDYIKTSSIVKEGAPAAPGSPSDGKEEPKDNKGGNQTLLIGLAIAATLGAGYFFMKGKDEEDDEDDEPPPRKKKATKKKRSTTAGAKKTATKKKRTKKKTSKKKARKKPASD
jgi:peptidyl-prolyl cis-trans isomerase A (cyclophilin A)